MNQVVENIVHTFTMSDVDDVEVYVAEPLYNWTCTDAGKFVMEHAIEQPYYRIGPSELMGYGYSVDIVAKLHSKDFLFYKLKYM